MTKPVGSRSEKIHHW